MHINFCNMIFITTIYLSFLFVYAWPKQDCNELLMNTTSRISSKQNVAIGGPNHPQENASTINEEEKNIPEIVSFLTREHDLSVLNIPFDNNKKAIDILKSALSSNDEKKSELKLGNKKDNDFEIPADKVMNTNLTSTKNISNDKIEPKENKLSATNATQKEKGPTISNILQTIHGNAIDLLKATASAFLAKDNQTENKEHSESPNTEKNISQDADKNLKVSNETFTKTEDPPTSTEIILSEITNLSLDNIGTASLGQTIEVQPSSMVSGEGENNTAGKEILQNTTGICGYLLGKRISFAEPTTLMEFPWTALLIYDTHIRYHCGGSLITTKYVLTAAHCVAQEFYELTGVRLGEYDISEPIDCAPDVAGSEICAQTVDADVVKIIIHHDYSHLSFKNDIALLRLDNDYIGRSFYPICLPTPEMVYSDRTATVAGWGATEKALRSSVLLKATVPIFDISKCREVYRYNVFNDSTEICASGANEVDVCKGDSGGAIFYNHNVGGKDKFFQLGIISLGVRGCGDKRFLPAVFTKINGFYKWIEHNLEY